MRDAGVYSRRALIDRGHTQAQVRSAVTKGDLIRLRRGWYATRFADPSVAAAVARGGVLSCLSALRLHGVWVPEHDTNIHVRANSENRRLPGPFCSQHGGYEVEAGPVDDVAVALRHAVRCLDDEGLVVVCDSILNQHLMTLQELADTLSDAPTSARRLLDKCDRRAQSGTETMVRLRLRGRRIAVTPQVQISGVGWVDLLVGERLIVEVDGEEFHTGRAKFSEDRRRDREAIRRGYVPVRFTYTDVVHRWGESEHVILELVRTNRHRSPRHNPHG
ncbi:Very-short-patch-repair endonuclease [Williamsia maris]|uniref:Very-short-patch-repair endonuclease n=1 Tax=Williamsia maris TaxID=72806 RepID=A0ABT1HFW9_9NOCA|nr:Very-short-patch-repair endonuclease [Williamsia maris]